ncbi:Hypothetical predicted protein [Mytilus galloprovincialis]|uniref:Uncharacterized protein n=1 Tax=Mytilus galloprovincialis TaxID=29158 RepID=A0A8B6FG66_MYTGA|nr:Hypothetical predicted protein [Mytilus galloprovincialis]
MDVVKQNFFAVLSVLEHLLQTIKTQLLKISEVYLRSDNAGCYHCGHLWLSLPDLSQITGIKILGDDFSEAHSGKSYCDAKIAHMRGKFRSHAAEGHNFSTAYEVKKAIECDREFRGTWRAYNVGEGNFTTQETVDGYSKVKQTSTDIHVVSDFSNSESLGNIKEKSLVPSVPEDVNSVHVDHTVEAQNDEDHTVDAVNN